MKMNFRNEDEFNKDFKKLAKKFYSLADDFSEFKKVLYKFPLGIGKHFNIITKTDTAYAVKARFFCKYLRKRSLRIIFVHKKDSKVIIFIELFFRGDKEREDKRRITNFLNTHSA